MFLVLKKIQDILMVIIDLSDTRSHKPKQSVFRKNSSIFLGLTYQRRIGDIYSDLILTRWGLNGCIVRLLGCCFCFSWPWVIFICLLGRWARGHSAAQGPISFNWAQIITKVMIYNLHFVVGILMTTTAARASSATTFVVVATTASVFAWLRIRIFAVSTWRFSGTSWGGPTLMSASIRTPATINRVYVDTSSHVIFSLNHSNNVRIMGNFIPF